MVVNDYFMQNTERVMIQYLGEGLFQFLTNLTFSLLE